MADTRIWTTMGFKRHGAGALIQCSTCKHRVIVSAALIKTMFPRPMPLDQAIKRLRCSNCGAKKADINVIRRLGRD